MENRRVSSSNIFAKECIVSALLQLIEKKPLSTITISELCEKAGVSRMTFYRNYGSKEDVFDKNLKDIFEKYKSDDIFHEHEGIYYDKQHMIHYFQYLYRYKDFMRGLMSCGFGALFMEKLNQFILEKWKDYADIYTLTAFSGALFNLFHLWSTNHYEENIEILAEKMEQIFYQKETAPVNG